MTEQSFRPFDISRRRLLRGAGFAFGAASLVGAGLSAAPAAAANKFPQAQAKYQTTPKGPQHCSNCTQFQPPASCQVVDGKISPNGWCLLYTHKG
jgi:hypothetical protein